MLSRFYVMQHGIALSDEKNALRPLSEKGAKDIQKLAEYLANRSVSVQQVFHSGKLRAEQTARIMVETLSSHMTGKCQLSVCEGLLPNDHPEIILNKISELNGSVLIVSHMPLVSRLCAMLTGIDDERFIFNPGTLAGFEWINDKWCLHSMLPAAR